MIEEVEGKILMLVEFITVNGSCAITQTSQSSTTDVARARYPHASMRSLFGFGQGPELGLDLGPWSPL